MTKEQHLLTILAEECAEVAKAASKAIRFGMTKYKPGGDESNRVHLEREVSEVVAMAEMLGLKIREEYKARKMANVKHYMEVSRRLGKLEKENGKSKGKGKT